MGIAEVNNNLGASMVVNMLENVDFSPRYE
jgi:hypothetical protein